MKLAISTLIATLAAGTAFAGGYTAPVADKVVVTPVVAVAPAERVTSWTGSYFGLQAGRANTDFTGPAAADLGDLESYGLHAGYGRDLGTLVVGGELSYDRINPEAGENADLWRARARVGYDAGKFQPYATLGVAHLGAEFGGESESGNAFTYGVGVDYRISPSFSLGAEYARAEWTDVAEDFIGEGNDVTADMVQVRFSYRY